MTIRTILILICAALLIGSIWLLLESSELPAAISAVSRGEPVLLPEDLLLGVAAFFGVLALSTAVFFWRMAGAIDRRDSVAAEQLAADLLRFRRESRTRDKARRAEVMRERSRWAAGARQQGAGGSPGRAAWVGALLAVFVISGIAAALAPTLPPRWLRSNGYAPCPALDETRPIQTRQSRGEVRQVGWALPGDCPTTGVPGR